MRNGKRYISALLTIAIILSVAFPAGMIPSFAATNFSDLIISEYVEGSSSNKAIEIYNGTGSSVDLSTYTVELYSNGATTATQTEKLTGTIEPGDVFVIANASAAQEILDQADITSKVTYFNGDDALLFKNGEAVIDSIGKLGEDPVSNWGGLTGEKTLVRKATVTSGDSDPSDEYDPAAEWVVYDRDTFTYLGSHTANVGEPLKKLEPATAKPASGEIEVGSSVELSSVSDGAIHITLDGSEPTASSAIYSEPIVITNNTTVKAIVINDGDADSDVSTFTYAVTYPKPEGAVTIAEARKAADESAVIVQGVVTSIDGKAFIQDSSAGINVYPTPSNVKIGDLVNVSGNKNTRYGMEQIQNAVTELVAENIGTENAQVVTASQIGESVEGELVTLKAFDLKDTGENGNYLASDATGEVIVDPKASGSNEWLADGAYEEITGIVIYEWNNYEIMPVSQDMIISKTATYYESAADLTGDALKATLNDIIDDHNPLTYSEAYDALIKTDADPNNPDNVLLFYSGTSMNGAAQYNSGQGWNREHVWAKSHGDFGTAIGPGTDLHMLRPTDVDVNGVRNHYDFDMVANGDLVAETTDCYVDTTNQLFEPRDEVKGDVARILFYMATRYEEGDEIDLELSESKLSVDNTASGYGEHGVLSTLLEWHAADPVDDTERTRNEIIYSEFQGNRNPFVDHPEYAELIWKAEDEKPVVEVTTIADARKMELGKTVTVEGIVLNQPGALGGKSFYLQDNTAGLLVYTKSDFSFEVGDRVRLTGELDDYNGKFELKNIADATEVVDKAGEPDPVIVTADTLTEAVEGKLVQLSAGVVTAVVKANDYGSTEITVEQNGQPITVFIDNRTGLKFDDVTIKVGDVLDIIGVVEAKSKSTYRIMARGASDFAVADVVDDEAPVISHTPKIKAHSKSDLVIEMTVTDNTAVKEVQVFARTTGQTEYKAYQATKQTNDLYVGVVGVEELSTAGVEYYVQASDFAGNIARYPEDPQNPVQLAVEYYDIYKPVVTFVSPTDGMELEETNTRPTIEISIADESNLNEESIIVKLDDLIISDYSFDSNVIRFTPVDVLEKGLHNIYIEVEDQYGYKAVESISFRIGKSVFTPYYGQLHAHTTYSDGQGTGDEAYKQARYEGKADFFALTDHSNWFDNELDSENIKAVSESSSETWKNLHADADKHNVDGEFVAIAGYEMTWSGSTGGWGHINTFNTPWFVSRTNDKMDLKAYYDKLALEENAKSVNQLNHPGKTFGDFADFGFYSEEVDQVVNLIEVGNGEGPIRGSGYFPSYEMYTRALDKGWHVAPSNNQDNHKGNFVISNEARTVVLGTELTREGIFDGIQNLRVFATEDSNLSIDYKINGKMMGSQLENPESLNFNITVEDPNDTDVIGKISIIADGGYVVSEKVFNSNKAEWNFTIDPQFAYYYVKVAQGDKDLAVTAPIWTSDVVPVGLSKVTASESPTLQGTELDIDAVVYNNSTEMISGNTTVKYYKGSIDEANFIGSTDVSGIAPGGQATASLKWTADEPGVHTIYAVTEINYKGVDKVFTNSLQVKVYAEGEARIILLDGGHQNIYVTGSYKNRYDGLKAMATETDIILRVNEDELTASDFENISALIITDPASEESQKYGYTKSMFTDAEAKVIADYVSDGGNLILTGTSDHYEGEGDYQNSVQANKVLEAVGTNLRVNDDQVIDNENNEGVPHKLLMDQFTGSKYDVFPTDIPNDYRVYRGASVIIKDGGSDEAVDWLVKAASTTEAVDDDKVGDNVAVEKGNVYMLAAEVLPGGGKVIVSGSTFFSDFEIDGDNQFANTPVTESVLEWVAPKPPAKLVKISDLKQDEDADGVLDLTGQRFAVEGYITSESEAVSKAEGRKNAFFEVVYVQDETGGITVFGVSTTELPLGTKVRIEGVVEQYDGDGELALSNEIEDVTILDEPLKVIPPTSMSTGDSMLESSEGLLVEVEGTVTKMTENALYLDDGSGEARVYVNGYIGDGSGDPSAQGKWDADIKVGDLVRAVGLSSEDPEGHRLRVRNTSEIVLLTKPNTYGMDCSYPETIVNGQEVRLEFELKHSFAESKDVTAIAALYSKTTGRMETYFYVEESILPGAVETAAGGFVIPAEGEYKIKVFLWDSFDDQNPLISEPLVIEVE